MVSRVSGFRSREVSSPASQSKLKRNFSVGRITRFFCFSAPRYCCLISSSVRSFSFSCNGKRNFYINL